MLNARYGGTKSEMQRLLADAEKITGIKYDINNLKDVYSAIHVIQEELGITGTTAQEATETLQGSISMLKSSWENFLSGSGNLDQVAESLTIFIENVIRIVSEAIPSIMTNLVNSLPKFQELGFQLIEVLSTAIIENLPKLLETGYQLVINLINGITAQLPQLINIAINLIFVLIDTILNNLDPIIDAGINLLLALIDGLIEAMPLLIDKVPEIVEKLIMAFIRNYPKFVRAGFELIFKLAMGIIQAIPRCYQAAGRVFSAIWDGIKQLPSMVWGIGKDIVNGIWNGISGAAGWLYNKVRNFAQGIINNIKNKLGIHSPSKIAKEQVGEMLPEGIAVGVEANTDSALKSIDKMNKEIMSKMHNAVNSEIGSMNSKAIVNSNNNLFGMTKVDLKVDGRVDIDGQKAGRLLAKPISNTYRMAGVY